MCPSLPDDKMQEGFNDENQNMRNVAERRNAAAITGAPVLWCLAVLFTLLVSAQEGPGRLDPTFGVGGKMNTAFGEYTPASGIAPLADGKFIVVGTRGYDTRHSQIALARYTPNGFLDASFGVGGKATANLGEGSAGYAVAVQPDGRIVVAGALFTNGSAYFDWLVTRFNSDGSLDETFGTRGGSVLDFGTFDFARGVAIQPDGKIVVCGEADSQFAVARLNQNGSPDDAFGVGGKTVTPDFGEPARANGVAILPDGKIIAAGLSFKNSTQSFAVARYKPNGALDKRFGTRGIVITNLATCDGTVPSAAAF